MSRVTFVRVASSKTILDGGDGPATVVSLTAEESDGKLSTLKSTTSPAQTSITRNTYLLL